MLMIYIMLMLMCHEKEKQGPRARTRSVQTHRPPTSRTDERGRGGSSVVTNKKFLTLKEKVSYLPLRSRAGVLGPRTLLSVVCRNPLVEERDSESKG